MRKIIVFVLGLTLSGIAAAQEKKTNSETSSDRQKELGITFSDLDSYGLTYRFGKSDRLWRLSSGIGRLNVGSQDLGASNETADNLDLLVRVAVGREYRKPILAEALAFRYGIDLVCSYDYSSREENDSSGQKIVDIESTTISGGFDFIIGVNYSFRNRFIIGAEITPNLTYSVGESSNYDVVSETTTTNNRNNFYLDLNNLATLSIVYAF